MGRPLNKRLFGADANDNLKVQFYNGTKSVPGYIVKQKGSKKFVCEDKDGNQATCSLVDKASADLADGEMTITIKYDNATAQQVTKIAAHIVTVDGGKKHWTFDTSTSDTFVQIEEAGTNTSLANNTDLEGDDINGDYPVPGSGTYHTAAVALNGVTYANKGTPYNPGGNVSSVANSAAGLFRKKYDGNFCAASNSNPSTWDYNFFGSATFIKSIADTSVSWGQQMDGSGLGEHNFSVEWKGYVQAPKTGNFNLFAESDDHIAVWIGTAATGTPSNATKSLGASNKSLPSAASGTLGEAINSNSVTLTSGQWYPIRIWFSEFNGGCKAQFYMQAADGTSYNGNDLTFAYNTTTGGF